MLLQYHPSSPSSNIQPMDLLGCPGLLHLKSLNRLSFFNWSNHFCDHVNCGTSWSTLSVFCVRTSLMFGLTSLMFDQWVAFVALFERHWAITPHSPFLCLYKILLYSSPVTSELWFACHTQLSPFISRDQWPKCLCLPGALLEQQGQRLCWQQQGGHCPERGPSFELAHTHRIYT